MMPGTNAPRYSMQVFEPQLLKKPVESFSPLLHQNSPLNSPISILSQFVPAAGSPGPTCVFHLHSPE